MEENAEPQEQVAATPGPAATVSRVPSVNLLDHLDAMEADSSTPSGSKGVVIEEEDRVLRMLARGIRDDLPEERHLQVLENLRALSEAGDAGQPTRVGSIYTGSDLAKHGWDEFLTAMVGRDGVQDYVKCEHTMGVEIVAWKRRYVQKNHPGLRFLFGGAEQMRKPTGYCYLHNDEVPWPHCDVLSVGSSCKDFSSLRGHVSRDTGMHVLDGAGTSGSTIQYAMAYIAAHRPLVLLWENVVGLFKGYLKKDAVTWELVSDVYSNLHLLLTFLTQNGYCAPRGVLNPSPRLPVNRRRAWLPCFLTGATVSEAASATVSGCGLSEVADELLCLLQERAGSSIEPERLLLCPNTSEHAYWLAEAIKDGQHGQRANKKKSSPNPKYKTQHKNAFIEAGLQYPPAPTEAEVELATRMRMTDREAEIVYFFDRVAPMEISHSEEMFIDLSQGITRTRASTSAMMPCITPHSRLWKRRAKEWLTAPEAMLAQGLDAAYVRYLKEFSHRQILNLMGNAFNSSSYLVSLATALSFVDLSGAGKPCPACDGVHRGATFEEGATVSTGLDLEAEMAAIAWGSGCDSESD